MLDLRKMILLVLLNAAFTICYDDFYLDSLIDVHDQPYRANHRHINSGYPIVGSPTDSDDDVVREFKEYSKSSRFGGKREGETPHPWNPQPGEKSYKTMKQSNRVIPPSKNPNNDPKFVSDDDTDELSNVILQEDAKLLLSLLLMDQIKHNQKANVKELSTGKNVARLYYSSKSQPPFDYRDLYAAPLGISDNTIKSKPIVVRNDVRNNKFPNSDHIYNSYSRLNVPAAKRIHGQNYYYGVSLPRYNPYDDI